MLCSVHALLAFLGADNMLCSVHALLAFLGVLKCSFISLMVF